MFVPSSLDHSCDLREAGSSTEIWLADPLMA